MASSNLNNEEHLKMSMADDQINSDYDIKDPYRTAFHFQPPQNWMNDPNGPFIYKGVYHFFYQYNPHEPIWRPGLVWGHSTSTDLINWTIQPNALSPSEPYDINGCWSGSTTILPGDKPVILYTGINDQHCQIQNLALPKNLSDPYLKEWFKAPQNPLTMDGTPTNCFDSVEFRDPSTAWQSSRDGKWRVIVGSQQGKVGLAVLFTSEDFTSWNISECPLHSAKDTGIWECVDFFPVYIRESSLGVDTSIIGENVKHVLKVSLFDTHHDIYTTGRYEVDKDIYIPDEGSIESDLGLRLDYGKYYASKSFFDSKTNRRIIFAWVSESSIQADDLEKGWSGLQAIPRTIVLDEYGKQLVLWPITEVETLRKVQVELQSQVIGKGSLIEVIGVTASQADVEITFKIPELKNVEDYDPTWTDPQILCSEKGASVEGSFGPFGLLALASEGLEEHTAIFFRIFKGPNKYVVFMCNDLSRSSLNPTTDKQSFGTFVDVDPVNDELSIRVLIDHSIVESFGAKGKSCITARVYPTLAINEDAKLYVFNYGKEDVKLTKLNAWSMKKTQINLSEEYTQQAKG